MSEGTVIPFGKYELLERLGTGGMAIVYRARYTAAPGITKPVVIKKVLDVYAENPSFVEQFIQEARVSVGLNHGNIVHVFDFGQVDGEYFLAMELVEGQPLSKVLKKAQGLGLAPLPAPLAVNIAIEMCKGLHHAHTRTDEQGRPLGLVHRDVSPDNVLISYEGEVKISDFGVAKAQLAGRPETAAGMVKGKYLFFSPEQALGEALDARSDVYAVGVVLFRMLCGRLPVEGPEVTVMQRIVRGRLTPALELNPHLDEELVALLGEAMAKKREERIPSAEALHQQLSHWLATRAPLFTGHTLKYMMGMLFEQELTALGRPPQVAAQFREQLARWSASQSSPEAPKAAVASPAPPRPAPESEAPPEVSVSVHAPPDDSASQVPVTTPDVHATPAPRKSRALRFVGAVGAVALLGVGLAAAWKLRTPPLEVRTEPPGAQLILDGVAVGLTPLKLEGIARDAPHRMEINLKGMRPWAQAFEPGALDREFEVTLEPVPSAPPQPPPPPAQPEAPKEQPPAEDSFEVRFGTEEVPTHFSLQEKWHSFSATSRSLQQKLDPARSYTVWTSGSYTGDAPISEQDLRQGLSPATSRSVQVYVFLEGEQVPPAERLFMASPKPHTFSQATTLHAFVLVGITAERNTDKNLTVHVRDNSTKQVQHLRLETRRNAHQVALENRYSVRKLDPEVSYELEIRPHEQAPLSAVAVLVVPKTTGRAQVSGQAEGEVRYALPPGRYVLSGARELWFSLPRAEADGETEMDVSLAQAPPAPHPPPARVAPPEEDGSSGGADEGAEQP